MPGTDGRKIPINPCNKCSKKADCTKPCFPRIDYLKAMRRRRKH